MKGASVTQIAEPYAEALMSIATSQDLVDRLYEDVTTLQDTLAESMDLRQFIENPFIKPDDKKAVLRQIGSDRFHPVMQNFLMLLVDRARIVFLADICKQYQALVRQARQIILAEVTSAVELNDEQKEAVKQKVVQLTGAQQVELEPQIDPDLIGGVVIKVGSQVFDASIRGQLRRLGLTLSSGNA